ncbi:MAG TPA: putative inorganic carbon transporter subunit DabA, partial [Cytophagales bacterium]|nr:putative inorganic carbon transporter subunit DabA [Cytophagales bacterium]
MEQLHFVVVCIKLYVLGDKLNVSMDVKAQNENIVSKDVFNLEDTINELKKYLPAQAPLKDFIFQNNLEAFLHLDFVEALHTASTIFGYKTYLSLQEFRTLYQCGEIRKDILEKVIIEKKGKALLEEWKDKLLYKVYEDTERPRVGSLRSEWITKYQFDIEALVNPVLFRVVCSYLDQGISIWNFPLWKNGFLMSIKEMEQNSFTSFFKTERPKRLLLEGNCEIEHLLS